jgi:hypothetical protein
MSDIVELVKNGTCTISDLIENLKEDARNGIVTIDFLEQGIKYFLFLEKMIRLEKENKMCNLQDLVDFGLCDNIDQVYDVLEEHKDEIGEEIRQNPITSPEPFEDEMNQIYDSEDVTKVCTICRHRKRHVIFLPCGHSLLCSVCCKKLIEHNKNKSIIECIVCKTRIEHIKRIYT